MYTGVHLLMPRDKGRGWRLDLGDDLEERLTDFSAAFYRAPKTEIIREALEEHMQRVLAMEPERQRRYDEIRRRRAEGKS